MSVSCLPPPSLRPLTSTAPCCPRLFYGEGRLQRWVEEVARPTVQHMRLAEALAIKRRDLEPRGLGWIVKGLEQSAAVRRAMEAEVARAAMATAHSVPAAFQSARHAASRAAMRQPQTSSSFSSSSSSSSFSSSSVALPSDHCRDGSSGDEGDNGVADDNADADDHDHDHGDKEDDDDDADDDDAAPSQRPPEVVKAQFRSIIRKLINVRRWTSAFSASATPRDAQPADDAAASSTSKAPSCASRGGGGGGGGSAGDGDGGGGDSDPHVEARSLDELLEKDGPDLMQWLAGNGEHDYTDLFNVIDDVDAGAPLPHLAPSVPEPFRCGVVPALSPPPARGDGAGCAGRGRTRGRDRDSRGPAQPGDRKRRRGELLDNSDVTDAGSGGAGGGGGARGTGRYGSQEGTRRLDLLARIVDEVEQGGPHGRASTSTSTGTTPPNAGGDEKRIRF